MLFKDDVVLLHSYFPFLEMQYPCKSMLFQRWGQYPFLRLWWQLNTVFASMVSPTQPWQSWWPHHTPGLLPPKKRSVAMTVMVASSHPLLLRFPRRVSLPSPPLLSRSLSKLHNWILYFSNICTAFPPSNWLCTTCHDFSPDILYVKYFLFRLLTRVSCLCSVYLILQKILILPGSIKDFAWPQKPI